MSRHYKRRAGSKDSYTTQTTKAKEASATSSKTFKVKLSSTAQRQLRKLDPHIGKQIYADIQKLSDNPRPSNYEQLTTSKVKLFRVPVGPKKNYRVVYEIDDEALLVLVLKVGDRKEIYR